MAGVPIKLSQTKPDVESLTIQLQIYLSTKSAWIDQQTSGTGQSIAEMIASVGAFNQFAIESNFREAFPYSALRDSSIYAATDMLGVHIIRKAPGSTTVVFTRGGSPSAPLTLPRLKQFLIGQSSFFNRDPVTFAPGSATSTPVKLYQGELRTQTFQGKSTAFQELSLNEPGFVVSDVDVFVSVTNPSTQETTYWTRSDDGLWIAEALDTVYYDRTDGNGDVILTFGDGTHAAMPSLGFIISITYAVTSGSTGNNGGSNVQVAFPEDTNIVGLTTTAVAGGADEKPASFYKVLGPQIRRARGRAINQQDYQSLLSSYPGVASVAVKAQRDVAPLDIRWMNLIRVCALPNSSDTFSQPEWDAFFAWFRNRCHVAIDLQQYNPAKRLATVHVRVGLKANALPGEVYPTVESNIQALFIKDVDAIGRRIAVGDIYAAADIDDVDYVQVLAPTSDFILTTNDDPEADYVWWELDSLTIETFYSERRTYNNR